MNNPMDWPAFDWTTMEAPRDAKGHHVSAAHREPDVRQSDMREAFVPSMGFMVDAVHPLTVPLLVGSPEMQTTTFVGDVIREDDLAGRTFTRRPAYRPDPRPISEVEAFIVDFGLAALFVILIVVALVTGLIVDPMVHAAEAGLR